MLVQLDNVEVTKAPKGYQIAEVSFTRDGKQEKRKIMSFAAPTVFNKLQGYKNFPFDVNITMEKNDKTGYWDWKDIETQTQGNSNVGTNSTGSKPSGKVIGSNYETPEERARRQVYIVRQSSLATAVELLKAQSPKGTEVGAQEVIETAKEFEAFVMGLDSFTDDVEVA